METTNIKPKTIFTGDNLPIMRGINSESVDLIYLDPPFNSNANYAAPIGSKAAGAEFKDTWTLDDVDNAWLDLIETKYPALNRVIHAAMTNSDKSYLIYMAARLLEMKRILKDTGSIYLHCDPTMSHYLKLVMDAVFGKGNFRNEVVWRRTSTKSLAKRYAVNMIEFFTISSLMGQLGINNMLPMAMNIYRRLFEVGTNMVNTEQLIYRVEKQAAERLICP